MYAKQDNRSSSRTHAFKVTLDPVQLVPISATASCANCSCQFLITTPLQSQRVGYLSQLHRSMSMGTSDQKVI